MLKEIIILIAVGIVIFLLVMFAVITYACWSITKKYNVLLFLRDRQYWAFAILNNKYRESVIRSESFEQFATSFSQNIIDPSSANGLWRHMPQLYRKELIRIIGNKDFIVQNLGVEEYSHLKHHEVIHLWAEYHQNDNSNTNGINGLSNKVNVNGLSNYLFDMTNAESIARCLKLSLSGKKQIRFGIVFYACAQSKLFSFSSGKGIDEYISMIHSVFPNIKGGGDKNIRAAYYTIYNEKKEAIDPNKTKYSSDIRKVRNELIKAASNVA